jgi:hypothetical protein
MRAYELALVPCERHGPRSWQDAGSCAEAGVAAEPRLASGSDEQRKPSPSQARVSHSHGTGSAAGYGAACPTPGAPNNAALRRQRATSQASLKSNAADTRTPRSSPVTRAVPGPP